MTFFFVFWPHRAAGGADLPLASPAGSIRANQAWIQALPWQCRLIGSVMTKSYKRAPAPTREEYRASAIAKLRRIGYTDAQIQAFRREPSDEERTRLAALREASGG